LVAPDYDIILTTDRTLMSNYRGRFEFGLASAIPVDDLPVPFFEYIFFPYMRIENEKPICAPYGLRKIESVLINAGYSTVVLDSRQLEKISINPKIIGIHTIDPLALGPTFSWKKFVSKGDTFAKRNFDLLMFNSALSRLHKQGAKIVIGGPGAWQFRNKLDLLDHYGIDHVIIGQAELAITDAVSKILENKPYPRIFEVPNSMIPDQKDIPVIKNPSINGIVEISRGCSRKCQFCEVAGDGFKWFPLKSIEKELIVNSRAGINEGTIHSDDALLYGSRSFYPNNKRLMDLFHKCSEYYDNIAITHASIASIIASEHLIPKIMSSVLTKQDCLAIQIGIETGSRRLLKKFMPNKAKPFKIEDWQELVVNASSIMHDNNILPYYTIITGLPGENEVDINSTIKLIEKLSDYRCTISQAHFIPMGKITNNNSMNDKKYAECYYDLWITCLEHNIKWAPDIFKNLTKNIPFRRLYNQFYSYFSWKMKRRLQTSFSACNYV
jgi:radical SAM superfamily enzyme YgiQ (UPF0313 family)